MYYKYIIIIIITKVWRDMRSLSCALILYAMCACNHQQWINKWAACMHFTVGVPAISMYIIIILYCLSIHSYKCSKDMVIHLCLTSSYECFCYFVGGALAWPIIFGHSPLINTEANCRTVVPSDSQVCRRFQVSPVYNYLSLLCININFIVLSR